MTQRTFDRIVWGVRIAIVLVLALILFACTLRYAIVHPGSGAVTVDQSGKQGGPEVDAQITRPASAPMGVRP